jgi:tetratricopeptide (TPR) repeat protein
LLEGERTPERYGGIGFPAASARGQLTWAFAEMGRFDEGSAYGEEAIRVAEPLGHPLTLAGAYWFLAQLRITRGEFDHAIRLTERGLAVSRDVPLFSLSHTASLGHAYACSGRTADGIALMERALSAFEATGNAPLAAILVQVMLGEAYVLANRLDDALAVVGRALTNSREYGHRNSEAKALRLLGDIAARRDSPGDAEGHYRGALALAEALGMRPLVAHCHAGLWRLFERMGKREEASRHQTAATTMYGEMKMTHWLVGTGTSG